MPRRLILLATLIAASLACSGLSEEAGEAEPVTRAPDGGAAAPAAPAAPAPAEGAAADAEADAASVLSGARERLPEGDVDENGAAALFNGSPDHTWTPGITNDKNQVILELSEPWDLTRIDVRNSPNEDATRDLRLEAGARLQGPWTPLADLSLKAEAGWQQFPVAAKGVRYVRITPRSTHVPGDYYGLDELRLRGARSNPGREIDFTGKYALSTGAEAALTQQGGRVSGCLGTPDLKLDGAVSGPYAVGQWRDEAQGTSGTFLLALTAEGGLSGVWGEDMATGEKPARWDADRSTEISLSCEKPVEEAPDAITQELQEAGRIKLYGVQFDFNKDTIKAGSAVVLQAVADAMKKSPRQRFRIEGHTDNVGGEAYNLDLSRRRAAAVARWLVEHGVPEASLESEGFGFSQPVLPNDTEAGRAANRRVEVAIVQ